MQSRLSSSCRLPEWTSWQSAQRTPFACILLWVKACHSKSSSRILPVGVERPRDEQRREVRVEELLSGRGPIGELRPPRVARGALRRHLGRGEAGGLRHQARVLDRGAPHGRLVGPGHVARARPVAGLAPHPDLRPGGLVLVLLRIVALAHSGGVAVGAHGVPALGAPRPVEPVAGRSGRAGVHVEPALLLRVPGRGERLQPPSREGHEVLLQRRDTEGVGHLEVAHLPVRPLGMDHELLALPEEPPGLAPVEEGGAGEVAEHRPVLRGLHGESVVRSLPGGVGLLVARLALLAADVLRIGRGRRAGRARGPQAEVERHREDDGPEGHHSRDPVAAEFRRHLEVRHLARLEAGPDDPAGGVDLDDSGLDDHRVEVERAGGRGREDVPALVEGGGVARTGEGLASARSTAPCTRGACSGRRAPESRRRRAVPGRTSHPGRPAPTPA